MNYKTNIKVGVLGGGQLGRMLLQSAIDLNIDLYIVDSDDQAPCADLAKEFICGDLTDFDTVYNWGRDKDIITIEIERVNIEALEKLESEGKKVFPQPKAIKIIQDKRIQKTFYQKNGIPTADFILTDNLEQVKQHIDFLPAFQKLGKDGYDGRGVFQMRNESDIENGFDAPSLLEKRVNFEKELSVIVARNENGEVRTFPVVEMVFHPTLNLVEYLLSPAQINESLSRKANEIAKEVITKLDMVGILAVEMFLTKDGDILVNEVAPRPHNSGHQTIEGNLTSQYEQHLRAILGLPLGDTSQILPAAMVNLLGEDGFEGPAVYEGLDRVLSISGVYVHLYGKKVTKPFRKMGHLTLIDSDINELKSKTQFVRDMLKVKA